MNLDDEDLDEDEDDWDLDDEDLDDEDDWDLDDEDLDEDVDIEECEYTSTGSCIDCTLPEDKECPYSADVDI